MLPPPSQPRTPPPLVQRTLSALLLHGLLLGVPLELLWHCSPALAAKNSNKTATESQHQQSADDKEAKEEADDEDSDTDEKWQEVEPEEGGLTELVPLSGKPHASAAIDLYQVGGLLVQRGLLSAMTSFRRFDFALRFGYAYLDESNAEVEFSDTGIERGEYDVSTLLRYNWARGSVEGVLGGNLRSTLSVAYGGLRAEHRFAHGVSLKGEISLNEIVDLTVSLRLLGVRDRFRTAVTFEPLKGLYGSATVDGHSYRTRLRESLGEGVGMQAELGYRHSLFRWTLDLRAMAYYEYNRLPTSLPAGIEDRIDNPDDAIDDLLLGNYAMVGGGPRIQRGIPRTGRPATRLYVLADLWLGWLWASPRTSRQDGTSTLGYDIQLGLGYRFPRKLGTLSTSAYVSNSRAGGFQGVVWGAGLKYAY